ncbi:hypothetical protein BDZ94DRAFT_1259519 [Collybia nuda]|uniref:FHA domain-containing protein n=1 Tax=Collybia nuda TaxID=64659 RepID=A0A9P6CER6_9AGAR|nr:hypothetical protein BDZ94DRAFT_1259519 [Collybia nuda]
MPAPAPFQAVYPALYLYPLNDSFVPKHISLLNNQRVKIGRQTNAKTAPAERNGFFDSKVLSRQHAEVWEENNKIYIKDVKSSNGTFINGDRLSPESVESEPYELKSDDIVEFGIDIIGEDNKTVVHHKVAARVVCVFTEQDVQVAARAEQHQQQHQQFQSSSPGSSSVMHGGPNNTNGSGSGSFNFNGPQRRPQLSQQGIAGMGGMGGSMRPPGKSGLTFDHILSRLQGELQKSRETGAELHTLTGAMTEINETLGGALPPNLPPYPHSLPPVRQPQPQSQQHSAAPSTSGSPEQPSIAPSATVTASALVDLQNQLQETQSSLTSHVDKIRALEGVLTEQETIKQEIRALREMMELKRREREIEDEKSRLLEDEPRGGFELEEEDDSERREDDDDDDDARSISTVVPHELERVEEEDEEQLAAEEAEHSKYHSQQQHLEAHGEPDEHPDRDHESERTLNDEAEPDDVDDDEESRRRRNDELGRPRTPEPSSMGLRDMDAYDSRHRSSQLLTAPRRSSPTSPLSQIAASANSDSSDDVMERVMVQVKALMALTTSLEAQHTAAQSTISALENKVEALEATVRATQSAQAAPPPPPPSPPPPQPLPPVSEGESLTSMINEWKKSMEGQWSSVREDWNKERERLNQAREEWENKVRTMDTGLERLATLQSAASAFQQQHQHQQHPMMNGDAMKHIGLVTPPSPRSLSSDSNRPRRRRSRSGGSRRGRSGQRSRSGSGSRDGVDTDTDATLASEEMGPSPSKIVALSFSSGHSAEADDEGEEEDTVLGVRPKTQPTEVGAETLATPDSSVYKLSQSGVQTADQNPPVKGVTSRADLHAIHMQTAIGVLVLSVAAAAVIWRVKPET